MPSAQRRDPDALRAGERTVVAVDAAGNMQLKTADGGEETVATDYEGRALQIYSVGCERDGRVYGGTLFPGIAYSYDLTDDTLSDLGALSHGAIQIYDIAGVPKGLYLASYMGCKLDYFDPSAPRVAGSNPRSIKGAIPGHERPNQWEPGPDGKLYFGTTPAKGRLGGALVCVDPADDSVRVWSNIIKDQSISYLTAVPETGELFGCCTVGGGSSAIATEEEAFVFLWDVTKEQVTWQGRPIEGTRSYSRAVRAANGLVYGVAEGRYYVFDPARREVVAGGELPVKALHFPALNDHPAGPRGLIYGLGDDAVFALNPADSSVSIVGRHPSIATAHGFLVTESNVLLYGSGADLWRWDLPDQ